MKVLFISQYYPPETAAPAVRVSQLAQRWARTVDVSILTGFPNYPNGIVPAAYRGRLHRLLVRETVAGVRVIRTWLLPRPNRSKLDRLLYYISFCASAMITGVFLPRPQVIIATSPPLTVALVGWWLARIKRVPFIFEVRDLWPESLEAVADGNGTSILSRLFARLARFLYRHCEHIVVVTPAFKNFLQAHYDVPPAKISVVENGVEEGWLQSHDSHLPLRRELGLEGKFVVSYVGTIGLAHGLKTILDAAEQLRQDEAITFLLVGDGAERWELERYARDRGLDNVRFLGVQPHERVPALIRASDVSLVLLRNLDVFRTVIPSKMLEAMACGRPVILGVDGQAKEILEAAHAGVAIEPENVDALTKAILILKSHPDRCVRLGRNGRIHVQRHYSRTRLAEQYLEVVASIAGVELPQTTEDPDLVAVSELVESH